MPDNSLDWVRYNSIIDRLKEFGIASGVTSTMDDDEGFSITIYGSSLNNFEILVEALAPDSVGYTNKGTT